MHDLVDVDIQTLALLFSTIDGDIARSPGSKSRQVVGQSRSASLIILHKKVVAE